ncbi:MAG: hypothetical protein GY796_17480, partial [Chloroflexi bacterium]|nr:hypothetical protein [Chloroflexota bacterium]
MKKRSSILFLTLVIGLLLIPTAVSRAFKVHVPQSTTAHSNIAPTIQLLPNCGSPSPPNNSVSFNVQFQNWPITDAMDLIWQNTIEMSWQAGQHPGSFNVHLTKTNISTGTYTATVISSGGHVHSQQYNVPCSGILADPPDGVGIFTGRTHAANAGIIATQNLSVLGQNICTTYGDPFSPLNSPWEPGPYTYKFRIQIPADYPSNILRVELFDPDSINASGSGPFTIPRTDAAINAGLPATTTGSCPSSQKDACLIDTGELSLTPNLLTLDQINPYFIWRIDENRGVGSAPGNGTCGSPANYDATFNTRTHFQLYYFQDNQDDTTNRVNLSSYTGQVDDGSRDMGDHHTDMHWVSPGAQQPFDFPIDPGSGQPYNVPVDAGSAKMFELDLSNDLPNIIPDPLTGSWSVYLDITALEGASNNGFEIWAGPPDLNIPSEANARNLRLLNYPGAHDSQGVAVTALENLPLQSHYFDTIDIPLTYIGPEYAGKTFTVGLFDSDAGAQPPITFYMDSMAVADWSLTFAQSGIPDPDGQVRNCVPGGCNDQWVTPPYSITLPSDANCDYANPTPQDCTPFYGGRLMARIQAGLQDTYGWEVKDPTTPPPTHDPTAGCSAFPITPHDGIRSVTSPGSGANPYPQPGDFDYPLPPPTYQSFIHHSPDTPLRQASEGDIYKVQNGVGSGGFGWLVWNEGVTASANTLAGSLTWPGNSKDYVTVASGQPIGGYQGPVNPPLGYVEPGDPTDTAMNIRDWVKVSTGAVNSAAIRSALNSHIDNGRVLRLPVYDQVMGSGANLNFQMQRFALFRLQGYNLSSQNWLLLEFIGWDDSCGQHYAPLTGITIQGPSAGSMGITHTFSTTVTPFAATTPITTVWQVDSQSPITHTGGLTDTVSFGWPLAGTYQMTVTAVNGTGPPVTDHHLIQIVPPPVPLTAVTLSGPITSTTNMTNTFTAVATPISATLPVTYTWTLNGQNQVTQTGGLTNTFSMSWPISETVQVGISAVNPIGIIVTDTHTIQIASPIPTADVVFVGPPQMVTSLPVYPGQEVQFNLTISNQGQADVATQFFVN